MAKFKPDLEEFTVERESFLIEGEPIGGYYYISTPSDPSVGMYGERISPMFKSSERLRKWWKRHGPKLLDAWFASPFDYKEFDRLVKKHTKK